ncbi:MAG: deoxyribose-phosphate aldolase [Bradymonadia bacterium]|jgi:deoxyribose-phosphate aldolase
MNAPYVAPVVPTVDAVMTDQRAKSFTTRSIKKEAKVAGLKMVVSMMDLTTLAGADTPGKVRSLCLKARQPILGRDDVPSTAAVCVYPTMITLAKECLEGTTVKVAAVSTYFPSGQGGLDARLDETRRAVEAGADEIDMVISRGKFLSGRYGEVFEEIAATKEACGDIRLKVILETGELETYDNVRLASQIAINAGADFIKTSTGKVNPAATMPVTLVMLQTIRDHYLATGKMVGMKPAGGIRNSKQALHYLAMVKETLGDAWLDSHWFRYGASSLLNDLLFQLEKQRTGAYQTAHDFSITGAY